MKSKYGKLNSKTFIISIIILSVALWIFVSIFVHIVHPKIWWHIRSSNVEGNFPTRITFSGTGSRLIRTLHDDNYYITAQNINGRIILFFDLDEDINTNFYITNSNNDGNVTLEIVQGEISNIFDITGDFSDYIDMKYFYFGRVSFIIMYEKASDVSTIFRWFY